MALSDHVTINVTVNVVSVQRAGFGVMLILSHDVPAGFTERIRFYSGTGGMTTDGFAADSPEVLAATRAFSQEVSPALVAVGRAANVPTLVYAVTPTVLNTTVYSIRVQAPGVASEVVSFTSDASATATEIVNGLVTELNNVTSKNFTATNVGDVLTITGDNPGDWFSIEVLDVTLLSTLMTHADPGVAADLAAINLENPDWYMLSTHFNSNAYAVAAADWIQGQFKTYTFDTNDTGSLAATGGGDTLDDLRTNAYSKVMGAYHPRPAAMMAPGWMGRVLPLDPGSATWKFKTLAGVPATILTATQRANLVAKRANFYEVTAGVNHTSEGTLPDTTFLFMDVRRGVDFLTDDMQKGVFGILAAANKIPFTDPGAATIAKEIRASLQRGVQRTILADSPEPIVTFPKAADVSAADKAARNYPDFNWTATLAGAIHGARINGTVVF